LIGASFGVGFIVGPMIGGLLGSLGHTIPFWLVGSMALLNCVWALFNLTEVKEKDHRKKISLNPFLPIIKAVKDKLLIYGYSAWFVFGIAISIQQSILTLFLMRVFGYNEFVAGLFLTAIGVVLVLNQGFFLKRFWIRNFSEGRLELMMFVSMAFGFFLYSWKIPGLFLIGLVLVSVGQSVLRVVMTSQMAGIDPQKRGEILGILNSVMSVSMIIGPALASLLFVSHVSLPFITSSLLALVGFAIIFCGREKLCKRRLPEDVEPPMVIG